MKINIKTLTPVHIGTGKKLGTLEFFNNYRISYDKLFELISEEKQEEFFTWLDQDPKLTVVDIQRKFSIKPQEIIKKCGLYSFSGSFPKEVNEGIKDSEYKLFIPGSSLKGSLRTALMYKVLNGKSNNSFLSNFLDELKTEAQNCRGNNKKVKDLLKNADKKLEQEVFICGVFKEKNNKTEIVYDDQKYDLMKLIKISDSSSVSTKDDGEITELQVYALNKVPAHKHFKTYTESIKDNVKLEFDISVDTEFLRKAKDELNDQKSEFGKKYFIGIEDKLKALFDIDIKNDAEFSEERIIKTIIDSWIDFGNAVSNLEKEWVNSVKNKGNVGLTNLNKLYASTNKFKVGFGTGFSGMTILSLLLSDNTLKQKAYDFYKSVGIGFHNSTHTPLNINEFPFTRKYSNNQSIYGGFGWVTFKLNGEDEKSSIGQNEKTPNEKITKPANTVIAEITDDKSKPPKVRILEGENKDKETILPGVKLETFNLTKGSKVYVELFFQKKILQKADYKGKAE